jgi:ABC-type multidrug transport system fused ATPase/permease subunit
MGSVTFLLNGCIFIAFMYGRLLITGNVKMGNVISAMFCALMGIGGIISITPNVKMIKEACISFSGYYNLYRRKPQIDLSNSIEKPPLSQIKGKIEFKDVSFYYPSDESKKKVLDKINLVFEPGKKVAIVGESGCGKSTIVNLIERLYEITEGQILIDGIEIKRYDLEYLRNIIGYVQQEPILFNKSIKENIVFGREEYLKRFGNIDQLIDNVSHEVYISEFIDSVPEKYDYNVGIKGSKLSGGQKQRVAIARAILANPKILILDEATSALDNISEKEVQKALDNISHKNVTTIIIAHRLSTVKNADLIYVIKNGKVEEKGNHDELLQFGGIYANLVRSQLNDDTIKKEDLEDVAELQKSRNTIQNIQFNNDNSKIALTIKDIPFRPCKLINELKDFKCMLFFAILSASVLGLLFPINGYIMAKGMNALNSRDYNQVKEKGFIFAFISLGMSAIQGIGTCLMLWKFTGLGVTLGRIFRKKMFAKYLQLHLSFFDLKENAPGALVTKLAIDTMN